MKIRAMPPEKHRRNTEMPSRQRDGIFFALSPRFSAEQTYS